MNDFQSDISSRRKYYRERRNVVRNVLLLLFVLSFLFCFYSVFKVADKKEIKVEIVKNNLVRSDFISNIVLRQTAAKNFFFIVPRKISNELVLSCGLLRGVVVRKYLFPNPELFVFVSEKTLWAKFLLNNQLLYVTDEGDLVKLDCLNIKLLPSDLTVLTASNLVNVSQNVLLILKNIYDFFDTSLKIKIARLNITAKNTLEIYTDNSIKINAGYIDKNLLEKIFKLSDVLNQIKKQSYLIQYIDLSLENGAVIKKTDETNDKKSLPGIFHREH